MMRLPRRYSDIYVVISPPRCCSTALARIFWEQPSIRYYSHEPFETTYYLGREFAYAIDKLENPLDLCQVYKEHSDASGLVIKEMPYQVGDHAEYLLAIATKPVVFLIRDPRLSVYSRMVKKREATQSTAFSLVESGWELLTSQVELCAQRSVPFVIIDASDFRNHPLALFPEFFEVLGLPFSQSMLSWRAASNISLDNLDGQHNHLYARVLTSIGVEPATETVPALDVFPSQNGFRDHMSWCLRTYEELRASAARIRPQR
jgi:hypothetical protein